MVAILSLILAAAVPDVTAGPALAEEATIVEAPIGEVTVYSDRARMRRRAKVKLKAGIHPVRLPDLPGAVMLNTVRVECRKARVLRVETVPVERERFSIDQVEEHITKLEALTDKLAALDRTSGVYHLELSFLTSVTPKMPVDESKRVGKKLPPVLVSVWKKVLDYLDERKTACRKSLGELMIKRRILAEQFKKTQREVQRHNLGAFTDRKIQVVAILQAKQAGQAALELEYFVPGASWKPAYNIYFDADRGRVTLKTAGMVRQATGEDWNDVKLSLSTAIPGHGIHLPELLTWALGEKREFIPRPRAARMPKVAPRFPPPQPQPTSWEAERSAKLQVIQQRMSELQGILGMGVDKGAIATLSSKTGASYGLGGLGKAATGKYGAKTSYRRPRPRKRRPSPKPPPPPMEDRMEMLDEAPSMSRSSGRVSTTSVSRSRRRRRRPRKPTVSTSLGLFEPSFYQAPRFSDPGLPAMAAGGLDYVYACPTRVSIPSTGQHLRIPLAVESYPVETFYEATPSLKTTAYRKAVVNSQGERPILLGPANIFVGGDFSGQGQLKTTGTGGIIELPLGADEDIRIMRQVVPKTVTEGLISKDDVTTYTTTIEIGNYKKKSITIWVTDQVPKTRNEDIEIEKGKMKPRPTEGPDADGIMRWKLKIPAKKNQTIQFSYKIERPENWQLTQ
jgi:hypothetical protein